MESRPYNYTWDTTLNLSSEQTFSFKVPRGQAINDMKLILVMGNSYSSAVTSIDVSLHNGPYETSQTVASRRITVNPGADNSITVDFSGSSATFSQGSATVYIEHYSNRITLKNPYLQYSYPALTASANPSSGYGGQYTTITFHNRLGESLKLQGYIHGEPHGGEKNTSSDSIPWEFPTPGLGDGDSVTETIVITDGTGRTTTVTITGQTIPQGTFTPSRPAEGANVNGGNPVNFQWSYSGPGSLVTSEISISGFLTISIGDGKTSHEISAAQLSPGSNAWAGRGYDSIAGWSPWSSDVSFSVYYNAVSQVVPSSSPTDGNISNYGPVTFSVTLEPSEPVPFSFLIASASFFWRSGTSGAYTELAMTPAADGLTASVVIAAGTFPNGPLQWYAEATDTAGNTSQTDTYTLTVVNSAIVSSPLSPIDTIESGTGPVLFRWSYLTLDGSLQNGAELEYSTNGVVWVPFAGRSEITGDTTNYTAPAGTFPGGTVYWHVRSYTQNNTPGPWSQAVSFQCFAAPVVQAVSATATPFSTITWQVEEQLAYEIAVDGIVFGPYFGANIRSFSLPEPLDDGLHIFRVRAQNGYGLWSEWAENTTLIQNSPGSTVTLTGADGISAALQWSTTASYSDFRVYRDGVKIGHTAVKTFTDRTALGQHSYFVINKTPAGDYARSSTVTVTASVEDPMIAPLAGGDFITLELSESSNRSQTVSRGREVAYTQYAGATFPEAEIGEHESLSISGDVAYTHEQRAEAAAFEALLGKPVIYKTPGGACVVGVLEGFQRRDPLFFKSYSFSVSQMDWRDFIDES